MEVGLLWPALLPQWKLASVCICMPVSRAASLEATDLTCFSDFFIFLEIWLIWMQASGLESWLLDCKEKILKNGWLENCVVLVPVWLSRSFLLVDLILFLLLPWLKIKSNRLWLSWLYMVFIHVKWLRWLISGFCFHWEHRCVERCVINLILAGRAPFQDWKSRGKLQSVA